jgi:hypothetical protein
VISKPQLFFSFCLIYLSFSTVLRNSAAAFPYQGLVIRYQHSHHHHRHHHLHRLKNHSQTPLGYYSRLDFQTSHPLCHLLVVTSPGYTVFNHQNWACYFHHSLHPHLRHHTRHCCRCTPHPLLCQC